MSKKPYFKQFRAWGLPINIDLRAVKAWWPDTNLGTTVLIDGRDLWVHEDYVEFSNKMEQMLVDDK